MHADVLRQVEAAVDADPAAGLLARVAEGDRVAMEHFYRQFQDRVYRYALAGLADPIAAADALQAVMVRVWLHARDHAGGDLMVWLLGFASREVLRRLSPQRQALVIEQAGVQAPPGAEVPLPEAVEDIPRVRAALAELPVAQRLALHLAFGEDMPHEDVADVLDCSEAVARTLILDAQRALKRRLAI